MKAWTLTAAAIAAALTLAGCAEDGPDVVAVPDAEPGDPAIYAPDGWPLEIGEHVAWSAKGKLFDRFPNRGGIFAVRSVDGEVYSARFRGPRFCEGEGVHFVYEGHYRAESETFDPETIYENKPIGSRLSKPGEQAIFLQFASEKAKRIYDALLAPRSHLEPLPAERAAQVRDNKRVVYAVDVTADGSVHPVHAYNYTLPTLRELYGPRRKRREEVPR